MSKKSVDPAEESAVALRVPEFDDESALSNEVPVAMPASVDASPEVSKSGQTATTSKKES